MIPIALDLRNFMSYRGNTTIDFEGIHLAAIIGDNGHGKSSLLDAITWAIWGKSRAKSDNDLITRGQTDMRVAFTFELDGQRYRIIRMRSTQGRGLSRLEFQLHNGTTWVNIGGSKLRETQREINKLLKVSYETFINSAFILQGRADEFTTRKPSERKEILADILGLQVYDELENRAKEKARQAELEVTRCERDIEQIEAEIAQIPALRNEVERIEGELKRLQDEKRTAEQEHERLRTQWEALMRKKEELTQKERAFSTLKSTQETLKKRVQEVEKRLEADERLLAQRDEIKARYAQLQAARKEEAHWNENLDHLRRLEREQRALEKRIEEERRKIENRLRALERRMHELNRRIAEAISKIKAEAQSLEREINRQNELMAQQPAYEAQRTEAEAKLAELKTLDEERERLRDLYQQHQTDISTLEAENKHLQKHIEALHERLRLLESQAGAECPVCRQPLAPEHRERVIAETRLEIEQAERTIAANEERIQGLRQERDAITQKGKQLRQQIERERPRWERARANAEANLRRVEEARQRLAALERELAEIQSQLDSDDPAAAIAHAEREALNMVEAEIAELNTRLEQEDYAHEARAKLAAVHEQIATLGYDEEAHQAVRQQVQTLANAEKQLRELETAEERLVSNRELLNSLRDRLSDLTKQIKLEATHVATLRDEVRTLPEVEKQKNVARKHVENLHQRYSDAQRKLGAAQQKLETAEKARKRLNELKQERTEWQERQHAFKELQKAFGKKGVQALIIEAILPEIADETNRLLDIMTNGRMWVRLESQRDLVSKDAKAETLDIIIGDEAGERPYEMYSGGEAFRINFALRIALSRLLAQRAGARLQTLFIDEGFGSQDAAGRERLVEAINAIKDEFERIFVITHIEELKDMFPVRLHVVKGPEGSRVQRDA
nr:SMC family ATPase [Ardenticatena sp.]